MHSCQRGARTVFAPELPDSTPNGRSWRDSCWRRRLASSAAHVVEPFGPVSTLLGYQDLDDAVALIAKGRSLVASSGPTPKKPLGSPSGSPFHGRFHTMTQHPRLRRPAMVHRATCSRRARSSGRR